jgi:hypothetical protein
MEKMPTYICAELVTRYAEVINYRNLRRDRLYSQYSGYRYVGWTHTNHIDQTIWSVGTNKEALEMLAKSYLGHGDIKGVLRWARAFNRGLGTSARIEKIFGACGIIDGKHPELPSYIFAVETHSAEVFVLKGSQVGSVLTPFTLSTPKVRKAVKQLLTQENRGAL